jgi:hypothetical protein
MAVGPWDRCRHKLCQRVAWIKSDVMIFVEFPRIARQSPRVVLNELNLSMMIRFRALAVFQVVVCEA